MNKKNKKPDTTKPLHDLLDQPLDTDPGSTRPHGTALSSEQNKNLESKRENPPGQTYTRQEQMLLKVFEDIKRIEAAIGSERAENLRDDMLKLKR